MANQYFTCDLEAWREGTTLFGRMHYYRADGLTYTYQDTSFPNPTMNLGGATYEDSTLGNAVRAGVGVGSLYGATFSRTVVGTGTRTVSYSAGSGTRSDFAGYWSKDVGGFPGTSSPPTGLACSNIQSLQNGFTATVSITDWGENNTGTVDRYRELQVWTASSSGLVEPRRYQDVRSDSLSGAITCDNSSSGTLTIVPNTEYTLGVYATNGASATDSSRVGNYTTLPPTTTISNTVVTPDSATFTYSIPNQGGKYDMVLSYQLDGGSLITVTTLTGSGTKSGSFTVSGLAPETTHTLTATLTTTAGEVVSNTVTFTTAQVPVKLYGSVNGQTKLVRKLYGSVNGQTKEITKLYGSVNGVTKRIF